MCGLEVPPHLPILPGNLHESHESPIRVVPLLELTNSAYIALSRDVATRVLTSHFQSLRAFALTPLRGALVFHGLHFLPSCLPQTT